MQHQHQQEQQEIATTAVSEQVSFISNSEVEHEQAATVLVPASQSQSEDISTQPMEELNDDRDSDVDSESDASSSSSSESDSESAEKALDYIEESLKAKGKPGPTPTNTPVIEKRTTPPPLHQRPRVKVVPQAPQLAQLPPIPTAYRDAFTQWEQQLAEKAAALEAREKKLAEKEAINWTIYNTTSQQRMEADMELLQYIREQNDLFRQATQDTPRRVTQLDRMSLLQAYSNVYSRVRGALMCEINTCIRDALYSAPQGRYKGGDQPGVKTTTLSSSTRKKSGMKVAEGPALQAVPTENKIWGATTQCNLSTASALVEALVKLDKFINSKGENYFPASRYPSIPEKIRPQFVDPHVCAAAFIAPYTQDMETATSAASATGKRKREADSKVERKEKQTKTKASASKKQKVEEQKKKKSPASSSKRSTSTKGKERQHQHKDTMAL